MFSSFSAALAALKAHTAAVDTVGHNLANVNTAGFKAVDIAFKDLVAESMGGGSVGLGVSKPITVRNFTQGSVQGTSGPLDAAIQGSGFFVVQDANGNEFYTRDGTFQIDKAGYVSTLTGERVLSSTQSTIQVPTQLSAATATTNIAVYANLNSDTATNGTFSSTVEVVDSKGKSHIVTLTFTKVAAANSWTMQASIPGEDSGAASAVAGTPFNLLATPVSIVFDGTGKLTTPAANAGSIDIDADLANANDLDMKLNLYDANGVATLSQAAAASSTTRTTQDGVRAGQIIGVGMADGGRVVARYDSGEEREIAKVAIALASNTRSLADVGNNLFRATDTPLEIGAAGEGGRGTVKGGALEGSTVDLAREFTNLIVYQRGYQANSRVITTSDELSQETLNLKR